MELWFRLLEREDFPDGAQLASKLASTQASKLESEHVHAQAEERATEEQQETYQGCDNNIDDDVVEGKDCNYKEGSNCNYRGSDGSSSLPRSSSLVLI